MNTKRYIISSGLLMSAVLFGSVLTSCQDSYDTPALEVPQATLTPNTTIAEFKEIFKNELPVKTPYKDEEKQVPYVIKGRVISSDASGNIYKSIVVQDETGALAFSVNQSYIYVD